MSPRRTEIREIAYQISQAVTLLKQHNHDMDRTAHEMCHHLLHQATRLKEEANR